MVSSNLAIEVNTNLDVQGDDDDDHVFDDANVCDDDTVPELSGLSCPLRPAPLCFSTANFSLN